MFEQTNIDSENDDWRGLLDCVEGTNKPINNASNVAMALSNAPEWKGQIWTDMFRHQKMRETKQWSDDDTLEALMWLQREAGFKTVFKSSVDDGVSIVARMNGKHPLKDYLNGLEWDGHTRIDTWVIDYLGVNETELSRAVGRAWLVSAVARVLQPGCQADHCLILEGRQGARKSTALRSLAGREFFAEYGAANLTDKDAAILCHGVWIMEFSELGALKTTRTEAVKSFVTRVDDYYRPPYGKNAVSIPRSCVFAGTTNEDQYMDDDTGNRRYWPVQCTNILIDKIIRDRDQIWAEAVRAYQHGSIWHLTPSMEKQAREEQAKRLDVDPWMFAIESYVKNKVDTNIEDVLTKAINKEVVDTSPRDKQRAAKCLKSLKWIAYQTSDGRNRWAPVSTKKVRPSISKAIID